MQAPSSVGRPIPPPSLSAANRAGWWNFVYRNSLYPRLALGLLCVLVAASTRAESTSLPSAPQPAPAPYSLVDYSLVAGIAAGRALDFSSTEACIHSAHCQEIELPRVIYSHKGTLIGFEAGMSTLSIFEQHALTRRGHRALARGVQLGQIGVLAWTAQHNYRLAVGAR